MISGVIYLKAVSETSSGSVLLAVTDLCVAALFSSLELSRARHLSSLPRSDGGVNAVRLLLGF